MNIKMKIHNIKAIKDFDFEIPTEKGLYALTGENASGKSTVISCASTAFYNPRMYEYFGRPYNGSKIEFEYGNKKRVISSNDGLWYDAQGVLGITGFFEGSLVFGNRFKDIDFRLLKKLSKISRNHLNLASPFIRENLGIILHDNSEYYDNLYILDEESQKDFKLIRATFYYEKNGMLINQLNMSTGENLLLTILYSIELRLNKSVYGDEPVFILLDEIELAFHSSALRRLVYFLEKLSDQNNFVVLFSTHSIELIRNISPQNIFYLQRHADESLELINPCYPIYATRNLESSNYGYDYIILVEDNLSKQIVDKILLQKQLLSNKRVLVIAVGGWMQVLRFAYDAIHSNLMIKTTKILIILDRDIKDSVSGFLKDEKINFSVQPEFLPVQSLEKFLLQNLVKQVDHELFRELNDYIFLGNSLDKLISQYNINIENGVYTDKEKIDNGKTLYGSIQHELHQIRKSESDLIDIVVSYLFKNKNKEIEELTNFLEKHLKIK